MSNVEYRVLNVEYCMSNVICCMLYVVRQMSKFKGQKDPGLGKLITKDHKISQLFACQIQGLPTSHFKCLSNVYISNILQMFYKSFSNVKLVFLCK